MDIKDNEFYGVKFEGEAIESILVVAKALLNITELFKAQNIQIDTLLKVMPPEEVHGDDYTLKV